ncbi:YbaB/EbfC family nucleoid-associated protein [Micromonospora echinofusca]|uniref:YbaB/EbfC family DNA-binding protein n=1 Tax=Micromonospora echinofusca TaxID=47858 RepID=A0ABS3VRD4_MICEH|nr:YbaB/EbfC family nucleoid-associated protein [Micromonospora echinofusca]MBO4207077.1 YbaB/EbfC family DNA-binding protein [Micromonospora echinofusca]
MTESADRDVNQHLRERFAEVHSQYQQLRSGLDDLQEQLAALRVTERSADGLVDVVVGPRGQVISVTLHPGVQRERDVNRLSRTITETIHRATMAATAATQRLVAGYLPAGSGALDYLREGNFGSLLRRSDAVLGGESEREAERNG